MVFRIVPHLHKVKIKLSHVQQMTANQNIDGIHVKLQLRGAVTHEPEKKQGRYRSHGSNKTAEVKEAAKCVLTALKKF